MSQLAKKSFFNFTSSILKSFGMLIITFVMTPILLRLIGAEDFGTFKVLTEIHSYLSLVEMGLLASLGACMMPLLSADRRNELESLLSEGQRRYIKVSLRALLFGLALFPFLKGLT